MDLGLRGVPALVTGASRGLGRAIALALAAEGARVAVDYRGDAAPAEDCAAACREAGAEDSVALRADVSSEEDIEALFDAIAERWGRLRILVNNAASCPRARAADTSLELWRTTLDTNLTGAFLSSRAFLRRYDPAVGWGRIVNIASPAAFIGSTSGQAAYDASKGGLLSLTRALSREAASMGVTVNAVVPGLMLTEMTADRFLASRDATLGRLPLRRFGDPEEIAAVVAFICGDKASYMSGAAVDVTGGLLMH